MILNLLADINNHWAKTKRIDDDDQLLPKRQLLLDETLEDWKNSFLFDTRVTKKKDKAKVVSNYQTLLTLRESFLKYVEDKSNGTGSRHLNPQDEKEEFEVEL